MTKQASQRAESPAINKRGWGLAEFAAIVSVSTQTLFRELPESQRPKTIRLRRRRLVVEPPEQWLSRMAEVEREAAQ